MDDKQREKEGMAVRREVLGDAYVDRSVANRNEFNTEWQDFITRYAWGEVWCRPGLERRMRSLIVLAILLSTGQEHEFRLHVRASRNNGVTREELKELFLQVAIYAGVPVANGAFRSAQEVFAEMDAEDAAKG